MKKILAGGSMFILAACAVPATGVLPNLSAKAEAVNISVMQPSPSCIFKAGVMGDANPDADGWFEGDWVVNQTIRENLQQNAANLGGNYVWVKNTSWNNQDVSFDYDAPFYVDNVLYSALVYSCP